MEATVRIINKDDDDEIQIASDDSESHKKRPTIEKNDESISIQIDQKIDDDSSEIESEVSIRAEEDSSESSSNLSPKFESIKKMTNLLERKNKHIKEIMKDLQRSEDENKMLKVELSYVKDKLSEATSNIKKQTILINNSKTENMEYLEQIQKLKNVQLALQSQIESLTNTNKKSEFQLDDFVSQMDSRINEWEDIIYSKEAEISNLKSNLNQLQEKLSMMDQRDPEYFNEMIKHRDDQMQTLQDKLAEAAETIINLTKRIEDLKKQDDTILSVGENVSDLKIETLKNQIIKLRDENEDLEHCLKLKEEELADTLEKIVKFETGDYGMKEVVLENKRFKQQLKIRDDQIRNLVAENNGHVKGLGQLQLENSIMRKKLNIPLEQPISTDNLLSKYAKVKRELGMLMKKNASLDEQNVSLKIRLRQKEKSMQKLYGYIKNLGIKIPEQFLSVILVEENLNQQAFEAEDQTDEVAADDTSKISINSKASKEDKDRTDHSEDTKVIINESNKMKHQLKSIEQLVKESGPNMSLDDLIKALSQLLQISPAEISEIKLSEDISAEKENHEHFKTMLKEARFEILSTLDLLAKESQKNLELQQNLTELQLKHHKMIEEREVETKQEEEPIEDDDSSINSYLKSVNKSYSTILHENLKHFHKQFKYLHYNMTEMFTENTINNNKWNSKEEEYKNEINELNVTTEALKVKIEELNKQLLSSSISDEEKQQNLLQIYPNILYEKEYYNRKSNYLEESLKSCKNDFNNLKTEFYEYKMKIFDDIKSYELELQRYKFNVANAKNELRNCISLDKYVTQNSKLNELQMKYRRLVNENCKYLNESERRNEDDHDTKILIEKNKLLTSENADLMRMLKTEKEKQLFSKIFTKDDDQVKNVTTQLIECQSNLLSLKKKLEHTDRLNNTLSDQLEELRSALIDKKSLINVYKSRIEELESENFTLQDNQNTLINKAEIACLYFEPNDEKKTVDALKAMNDQLNLESVQLKNKLQAFEEQINDINNNKLVGDLESNLLRHQVLDLQSGNDNKAIIARLSGEILVSHIHTTEMHKKKENLLRDLTNYKEKCSNLEKILNEKDAQFDNYVARTNLKICSALQIMREQYQGSIPLILMENLKNNQIELRQKLEKLTQTEIELSKLGSEIEDNLFLRALNESKIDGCIYEDIAQCPHYVEMKLKECKWERERSNLNSTNENVQQCCQNLEKKISELEESLLMLTFIFDKNLDDGKAHDKSMPSIQRTTSFVELTDVDAEELNDIKSKEEKRPIPLPRTFVRKSPRKTYDDVINVDSLPGSPVKSIQTKDKISAIVQTDPPSIKDISLQADLIADDPVNKDELSKAMALAAERYEQLLISQSEISVMSTKISTLESIIKEKDNTVNELKSKINSIQNERVNNTDVKEIDRLKDLLDSLKNIEADKDLTINKYKQLLEEERNQHNKSNSLAQTQINEMKSKIDTLERDHQNLKDMMTKPSHVETYNATIEKYRSSILSLEDQCFQLQQDIERSHGILLSTKSECERWKSLAAERFTNMEILNRRLEERHMTEVTSYKSETNHWISELSNAQRELSDVKMQFGEYKTNILKEISDRQILIGKLSNENSGLKEKILNLQAVISMSDPTFEFSAIEEIDYTDKMNQTDDMEKLDADLIANRSLVNRVDNQNIWSEALLERLRKEKQMITRQNILLRKQIKILGARERRSRLESQNLKLQMSKKMSPVNKFTFNRYEEVDVLLKKIESLEFQLAEKRSNTYEDNKFREKQIVLWDKQKRWQENAERWKQQYLAKCEEFDKLQKSFNSSKVVLQRLEREKRTLDSRLSKYSRDEFTPSSGTGDGDRLEMLLRDKERLESEVMMLKSKSDTNIKHSSLIERIEIQQRRIAALELAERGKDVLISEYERLLAQNSLLAKQNIKLESEILENQLSRIGKRLEPDGSDGENECCRRLRQQNQHLENYVKLLKEENSQLIARKIESSSMIPQTGTSTQAKRISDLERTVLTLRGLIGKLQAENRRLKDCNSY